MKKVLVIGKGFISDHLNYEKYTDRIIADYSQIEKNIFETYKPDVIINTIGRTGLKNIDDLEKEKPTTLESNTVIPIMLAQIANKHNVQMLNISSGCIFYGHSPNISVTLSGPEDKGWKETNSTNPKSFYSKTKYACDTAISTLDNVCVMRIRMPISDRRSPRNLITKILGYSKVVEEPNSVTFLSDLINAIDWVISNNKTGIYNVCSPKPLTHSIFLEEYKKYVPSHTYEKINVEELNKLTLAERSNCILNMDKIIGEGFKFMDTDACVRECIKKYVNNK